MRPRTKRRLSGIGNWALAAGGGALALGLAAPVLVPTTAPIWLPLAFKVCTIVGGGVTAWGVVCKAADALGRGVSVLKESIWAVEIDYLHRLAIRAELEDLYAIAIDEIGDEVVRTDVLKSWFDRNPEIFWVLVERRTRLRPLRSERARIVGYFILVPLSEVAALSVRNGSLRAFDFKADHISPANEMPAAIYLGAVCSRPGKGRIAVMNYLRIEIRALVRRGICRFLTRPVNQRGLDLARAYGFDTVSGSGPLKVGHIAARTFRKEEHL